jgi:Rieske Fe-S protein
MAEDNVNEEIEVEEESKFSRRTFLKFFMGVSAVLTVVPFAPMVKFFFTKKEDTASAVQKIANINDVPPGSTHVFFYPGEEDKNRSFLVHLTEEEVAKAEAEGKAEFITDGFVAYNTICSHLQCPTELPEHEDVVCPCHGASFHKFDGSVVSGPPPRALPIVTLEVDHSSGEVLATGMIGNIGTGRET